MLTMGMTGRALTDYVGDGRLTKYGVRFMAQVWPGDDLTATLTVTDIHDDNGDKVVDLEVVTRNQDGVEVVRGYASARIDP
jgi:acyl dehydratase